MHNEFNTWLTENDILRIWNVIQGILPNIATSTDELNEFNRLINHIAMIKSGGNGYHTATLQ